MTDKCLDNVYNDGECIAVSVAEKKVIEWACQETQRRSGALVDWHYVGGRGRILALGDAKKAAEIFQEVMDGVPPEGCLAVTEEKVGRR